MTNIWEQVLRKYLDQTGNKLETLQNEVKAKFTIEQAKKAQRGIRSIALLFLEPQR